MLTVKQKQDIANDLLGSCSNTGGLADIYLPDNPFDGDAKITEAANDCGVWLCECCGWWHDEGEMEWHNGEYWCEDCINED